MDLPVSTWHACVGNLPSGALSGSCPPECQNVYMYIKSGAHRAGKMGSVSTWYNQRMVLLVLYIQYATLYYVLLVLQCT